MGSWASQLQRNMRGHRNNNEMTNAAEPEENSMSDDFHGITKSNISCSTIQEAGDMMHVKPRQLKLP